MYLMEAQGCQAALQSEHFYLYFMLTYLRRAWEVLHEND